MDRTLRLWEAATEECVRVFKGHTDRINALGLSTDGNWALSGSNDRTLRLWELATGRCSKVYEGHTGGVLCVTLSPDGRFAFSGAEDKTLRIWEVETGRCVQTYEEDTAMVYAVALNADARWLLSGGDSRALQLRELDWELVARDPADWDEGALPTLQAFLSLHTPCLGALRANRDLSEERIQHALTRRGRPLWAEHDFHELLHSLQLAGYGWLRPDGVRTKLEAMARALPSA
jgi:hypothetical protein